MATSYQLAVVISLLAVRRARRKLWAATACSSAARRCSSPPRRSCAMATSLPMLVAARFAQGLGGGAIMAITAMLLRFTDAEGAARRRRSAGTRWRSRSPAPPGRRSGP